MTPETPIACSLSADELPRRLAEMRAIGRKSLLSVDPEGTLRFRADDATRRRLRDVIAAESRCCGFLGLDLREDRGGLTLTITAPEGAEPLASDLVDAFAGVAHGAGEATG
jgi:hypothetical protein